jgi:hypothetical protein
MANANYLVTQRDVKTTFITIHRRSFSVIAQPYFSDSEAT